MLVGHVTKDGGLAGPRVLEHMVDAVLYFEGDRGHQFRILRAVKNRFGATDEIGVFEMTETGLAEVANPSALFLAERRGNIAGSAVFAGLEGTRPVLVEIQALLAPNPGGSPRRSVIGWDGGRLSMLLAVLETRAGVRLNETDVYLNIAGGLRVTEPAADLAVAAAHRLRRVRHADQPRHGLFRRGRPVRRSPPGRAGRGAPEGSRQAWLRLRPPCRAGWRTATGGWRHPMGCDWRKSATSPIWLPDLPPNRPRRTHDPLGDGRQRQTITRLSMSDGGGMTWVDLAVFGFLAVSPACSPSRAAWCARCWASAPGSAPSRRRSSACRRCERFVRSWFSSPEWVDPVSFIVALPGAPDRADR